jgi:hypothetical protein
MHVQYISQPTSILSLVPLNGGLLKDKYITDGGLYGFTHSLWWLVPRPYFLNFCRAWCAKFAFSYYDYVGVVMVGVVMETKNSSGESSSQV